MSRLREISLYPESLLKPKLPMNFTPEYGKSLERPIQLNSIPASMIFLNNLVTEEGLHLIYHRIGSIPIEKSMIDHYEIIVSNNKYDDFFIQIYNERSNWIPPSGYLFGTYPEDMNYQLMLRENITALDEEDIITFDEEYIFHIKLSDDLDESLGITVSKSPLERILLFSCGNGSRLKNFPFELIDNLPVDSFDIPINKLREISSSIQPRVSRPNFLLDALSKRKSGE